MSGRTARTAHAVELIRALAVAGFAASNIMLLSVSVWSGAEAETRDLFHWLSAIIALPALAYSGRVFFRSAWQALRHGRTNMDVPISIGVVLAFGMSLYDTVASWAARLFRCRDLAAVLPADRPHARPPDARAGPAGGQGPGAARGARRHRWCRPTARRSICRSSEILARHDVLLAAGERVPGRCDA